MLKGTPYKPVSASEVGGGGMPQSRSSEDDVHWGLKRPALFTAVISIQGFFTVKQ